MAIAKTDVLFDLISSLDKSEKRHFKIYANRLNQGKESLFVQLFDLLVQKEAVEDSIIQKSLKISSSQYTNTKRHLYNQILKSLRLLHTNRELTLSLREQYDYATLLYSKGLHNQCFLILDKLKPQAKAMEEQILLLDILGLQKRIESRHITRSRRVKNKMEQLISESEATHKLTSRRSALSNLSLKIQGLYIKLGFAKNDRDIELFKAYFNSNKIYVELKKLSVYEKVFWHQSHIWYNYVNLNFHFCYKHSVQWVEALEKNMVIKSKDPGLYIRGLHYVLTNAFYLGRQDKFKYWFKIFQKHRLEQLENYKETTKLLDFSYYQNALLNSYIVFNKYTFLEQTIKEIQDTYGKYSQKIDVHRIHMFYYKIAMLYSYTGHYEKAIDYLNMILNASTVDTRKDIVSYGRLLLILCHFRLNNFTLVDNLIDSIRNDFQSFNQSNKAVELMLQFLRRASKAMNFGIDDDIIKLQKKLLVLQHTRFDKIAFVYYDYYNWCESMLKNTTIEKVKRG